ncbi:MAG: TIGR03936 family radical SAM-associated protein [Anaerolineae bacterium]
MRLRILFSKEESLTYTSHLDLMRVWERALRRANVPLTYSQGFNPRPKLQLAAALPLGYTGAAELLDVWLRQSMSVRDFTRVLVPVLPAGLTVNQVRQIMLKEPAMQTQVVSAEYHVTVEWVPELACPEQSRRVEGWDESTEQVEARIERVLATTELLQERRGRQYDLRPLVEKLWLEQAGKDKVVLGMQLAARQGATARPEAVLEALGMNKAFTRYHRLRLVLDKG